MGNELLDEATDLTTDNWEIAAGLAAALVILLLLLCCWCKHAFPSFKHFTVQPVAAEVEEEEEPCATRPDSRHGESPKAADAADAKVAPELNEADRAERQGFVSMLEEVFGNAVELLQRATVLGVDNAKVWRALAHSHFMLFIQSGNEDSLRSAQQAQVKALTFTGNQNVSAMVELTVHLCSPLSSASLCSSQRSYESILRLVR
jgi:Flp pilus assembly protein TadD